MEITAVILAYHEERKGYLPVIIRALLAGTVKPTRVIVFCNGTQPLPSESDPNVVIINSNHNFGCVARYAVALLSDTDIFFFQDDDLVVERGTLEGLMLYQQSLPDSVLGFFGRQLDRGSEKPYTDANFVSGFLCETDVVYRIHLCHRKHLLLAHELRTKIEHSFFRTDDLLIGLANRAAGRMNYVVPTCPGSAWQDLEEDGIGLSHEVGHYDIRDKTAKRLLEIAKSNPCFVEALA